MKKIENGMIQHEKPREIMYQWHGGQSSAFYAAASSGLVASFGALVEECDNIDEPDRTRLKLYILLCQRVAPRVVVLGQEYAAMPWAKIPTDNQE